MAFLCLSVAFGVQFPDRWRRGHVTVKCNVLSLSFTASRKPRTRSISTSALLILGVMVNLGFKVIFYLLKQNTFNRQCY
jgi:hypothetical protein